MSNWLCIPLLMLFSLPVSAGGDLIVVGGGSKPAGLYEKMLTIAGGEAARIVVVPWASERPDAGESTVEAWTEAGARSVALIPTEKEAARKAIESANLIWFGGGDQSRLMAELRARDLIEIVRARHQAGTVMAGTSAGAAVMSKEMITGEAKLESLETGTTELVEGLGLWSGVIVDQHFLARRRWARLFTAVASRPGTVGVGIDEQTAVVVSRDGSFEVIGRGPVVVIDSRGARIRELDQEKPVGARGLRVDLVTPGEVWRPRAKR